MATFSPYFMRAMTDHICGLATYTAPPLYLGFGNSPGSEEAAGVTGYARQPITFGAPVDAGGADFLYCANTSDLVYGPLSNFFPLPGGGFQYANLYDAPSAGNLLWTEQTSQIGARVNGAILTVAAGDLRVSVDFGGRFEPGGPGGSEPSSSKFFEMALLNLMLRAVPFTPVLFFGLAYGWSLSTGVPVVNELTEPGYSRVNVTSIWQHDTGSTNSNVSAVTFSASGNWSTNVWAAFFTDGGNFLWGYQGWHTLPAAPVAGDSIVYPATTPGVANASGVYVKG